MAEQRTFPPQQQTRQPGIEAEMRPRPRAEDPGYRGCGKLRDKVSLMTGGDSGIGRAVALAFAKEGADAAIVYLNEHQDAEETRRLVEKEGRRAITVSGEIGVEESCRDAVERTVRELPDYASTKGAIAAFTRWLAHPLADKKIRVNAVAPGPVWIPLIPASFPPEQVEKFGSKALKRAGQPEEIAVFLASDDASYMTGRGRCFGL